MTVAAASTSVARVKVDGGKIASRSVLIAFKMQNVLFWMSLAQIVLEITLTPPDGIIVSTASLRCTLTIAFFFQATL